MPLAAALAPASLSGQAQGAYLGELSWTEAERRLASFTMQSIHMFLEVGVLGSW